MIGSVDEEHIITKVLPGMTPLQDYEEDDPSQVITINYETDNSNDVDDLSEVSMASGGGISKDKFQGLLGDIAALAAQVEDMSTEQVEHKFRANKSTLMECSQGYKYWYQKVCQQRCPSPLKGFLPV